MNEKAHKGYIFDQIYNGSSVFINRYHYTFINQKFDRNEISKENIYTNENSNQFNRKLDIIIFIRDDNRIIINLQIFNTELSDCKPFSLSQYLFKHMKYNEWINFWGLKTSNHINLSESINIFFQKLDNLIMKNPELSSVIRGKQWLDIPFDFNDYYR